MTETTKDRLTRLMCEARDIVSGDRPKAYGPPERNFGRIAVLWQAYLAAAYDLNRPVSLTARDVCHMLDLLKLARLIQTPNHEDSIRDRFGYQACYVDLVYGGRDYAKEQLASLREQAQQKAWGEGWQAWPGYDSTIRQPDIPVSGGNVTLQETPWQVPWQDWCILKP